MKQTVEEISYKSFGANYTPTEQEKKSRAFKYALALTAFEEVGAGADDNLQIAREVVYNLKRLCLSETGYVIENAENALVGSFYKGWKQNPYEGKK